MGAIQLLREQLALPLFLLIGAGCVCGRVGLAGIQLGTSTAVLFGGLVLGNWGVHGTSGSQSIGFMLFIYCVLPP